MRVEFSGAPNKHFQLSRSNRWFVLGGIPVPLLQPVPESDAEGKAVSAYSRIREILEVDEVPVLFQYMGNVPIFVHDFFMNFRRTVLDGGKLGEKAKLLVAIATAGQAGSQTWQEFLQSFAESRGITRQECADALAVGATNSMYNVLFKFRSIAGTDIFEGMPVGLRAHTFQGTDLDESLVELINLTLSDVNGCQPCTSAHVAKARALDISDEAIYEAVQCAATMIAGTQFLRSIGVD